MVATKDSPEDPAHSTRSKTNIPISCGRQSPWTDRRGFTQADAGPGLSLYSWETVIRPGTPVLFQGPCTKPCASPLPSTEPPSTAWLLHHGPISYGFTPSFIHSLLHPTNHSCLTMSQIHLKNTDQSEMALPGLACLLLVTLESHVGHQFKSFLCFSFNFLLMHLERKCKMSQGAEPLPATWETSS